MLHGHGRRERQVLGPPTPGAQSVLRLVWVRRYLCTACDASMTVVPREVLTKRLYSGAAIGMCMALFGLCAMSLSTMRALVSPFTTSRRSFTASSHLVFGQLRFGECNFLISEIFVHGKTCNRRQLCSPFDEKTEHCCSQPAWTICPTKPSEK